MDWSVKQYGDIFVIALEGNLDAVSVPHTEAFLEQTMQQGHNKIIINLHNVSYISSAGVRLLFSISQFAKSRQGLVCVCGVQESVSEVMKLSGADQVLSICQSEQECFVRF